MKNKHGVLVFVMALAVSVLTITESARAITIDSFDTTSQSISANSSSTFPVSNTVAASEAIGGFRTLEILGVAGPSECYSGGHYWWTWAISPEQRIWNVKHGACYMGREWCRSWWFGLDGVWRF